MPPATGFAFDGSHVFLTYPQCPLERTQLRDFFLGLAPGCKYFISRELHDDGNPHLHAYVHFGGRRRFVGADCFDVEGYHPNIQKPRSARNVIAYCAKADTEPLVSKELDDLSTRDWGGILDQCTSKDEFLSLVRQRFPRDYVLSLERLLYFCEWRFTREETTYSGRTRDQFREPLTLTEWVTENITQVSSVTATASTTCCSILTLTSSLGSGATALSHSYWRI